MARTTTAGVLATVIAGCTLEQGGNDPFGSPGTYTTAATAQPGSDESGASESSGSGDTGGDDTSGAASESSGDAADAGSTSDTGIAGTSEGSTGDGALPPGDGQPMDGMWSHCTTAQECGPIPALCVYSVDAMQNPVDGFCTETACANAAVDCLANPGGTAPPICIPMEIDGMPDQICALSCAAGTCPTGMVCMNFTDLGMICM